MRGKSGFYGLMDNHRRFFETNAGYAVNDRRLKN